MATSQLSSPGLTGDPVRRGSSAEIQAPLAYWIARSSRATTAEKSFEGCVGIFVPAKPIKIHAGADG